LQVKVLISSISSISIPNFGGFLLSHSAVGIGYHRPLHPRGSATPSATAAGQRADGAGGALVGETWENRFG